MKMQPIQFEGRKFQYSANFRMTYLTNVNIVVALWCLIMTSKACTLLEYSEYSITGTCHDSSGLCIYDRPTACILVTNANSNMTHSIRLRNASSLIYLRMYPVNVKNVPDEDVTIEFSEYAQSTAIWKLAANRPIANDSIVSQSSMLTITLSTAGNWTDLVFDYEELMFETKIEISEKDSGTFGPPLLDDKFYRPNGVSVFHLVPFPGAWNESSVMVTLSYLDVDEFSGDYLLIGSGKEPFSGPPAVFLTGHKQKNQKYYVAEDDAYFLFFAQASNQKKIGFKITWERSGNRIKDQKEPEDNAIKDSVLQAVQICFYNASWIQEFNRTGTEPFPQFRDKFASIANQYVKEKEIPLVPEIKANWVKLFRVSAIITPNEDLKDGVLYVMLTIVQPYDERVAIFRWEQLVEILARYDTYDKKESYALLGFKIGECPAEMDYREWYISTTLMLFGCVVLFFGVWFWRYSAVWKSRRFKNTGEIEYKHPGLRCSARKVSQSVYVNGGFIIPTLKITDEDNQSASINAEEIDGVNSVVMSEDSDVEIFTQDWIMKSKRYRGKRKPKRKQDENETHVMTAYPVPTTGKRVGQSNLLWKENKMDTLLDTEAKESVEQLYDSLDAENVGSPRRPECDTKL